MSDEELYQDEKVGDIESMEDVVWVVPIKGQFPYIVPDEIGLIPQLPTCCFGEDKRRTVLGPYTGKLFVGKTVIAGAKKCLHRNFSASASKMWLVCKLRVVSRITGDRHRYFVFFAKMKDVGNVAEVNYLNFKPKNLSLPWPKMEVFSENWMVPLRRHLEFWNIKGVPEMNIIIVEKGLYHFVPMGINSMKPDEMQETVIRH